MIAILSAILMCLAYILMILVCILIGWFLLYAICVVVYDCLLSLKRRKQEEQHCVVCNRKLFFKRK